MEKEKIKELAENGELITISKNIKDKTNIIYKSLDYVLESIKRGTIKELSDNNPFEELDYRKFIDEIRNEKDHNRQNELKVHNLPVFYQGGILNGKVEIMSNTIFIDIDDYDFSKYNELLEILKSWNQVYTIFSTPSNKYRLKVGIKHNLKDPEKYNELYKDISKKLESAFMDYNLKVDTSCSNPNKPIFFSYDPEIYINYDFEEYKFNKDLVVKEINMTEPKQTKEINLYNDDSEYWVYIEEGNGELTKYNTSKGYFSTRNIDKAIFDIFRFNYWNDEPFGKFEEGNRGNWIYKTSQELFQYIEDFEIVVGLYKGYNSTQINRLDNDEIERVLNNSYKAFQNKTIYNKLGCRRNYAITKVAKIKRDENINKRKGNKK